VVLTAFVNMMTLPEISLDEFVELQSTFLRLKSDKAQSEVKRRTESDFCVSYTSHTVVEAASSKKFVQWSDLEGDTDVGSSSEISSDSGDESVVSSAVAAPPGVHAASWVPVCPVMPPGLHDASRTVAARTPTEAFWPARMDGDGLTTLMLRHLPNHLTRAMLLELLDSCGFKERYDFVFLPMHYARKANLGYCFVNLVDSATAVEFWNTFDKFSEWPGSSRKACELSWNTTCQGLDNVISKYRNWPVMHEDVPDEFRPILLEAGVRVPFPAPTEPVQAPKVLSRQK